MKLLVIDSNALLHRSFHALPPLTTKKGEQTGAVYGFLLTLFKAIKDIRPDFLIATFDTAAPTFRHEKFKEYKAKREKAPEEFYQQFPKVKEILKTLSIPIFEKEGFEADDLIATISKKAHKSQVYPSLETYIVTGDLDTLQLIDKNTKVYTLGKGIKETLIYDTEKVRERWELEPKQMVDFKALAGDPSDNIPGATGIGQKTAIELLKKYKSIENIYDIIEKKQESFFMKSPAHSKRIKNLLIQNKEQVFFSRVLVRTREDVPIELKLQECRFGKFDREKLSPTLKKFEFHSLLKRIPEVISERENENQPIKANNGKLF